MASARDVARWRTLLSSMLPGVTLVHVLNRFDQPDALPLEQFAQLAGGAPDITIPYCRDVAEASVLGLSAAQGFATLDTALEPLVEMISGTMRTRQARRQSLLDRLLRRR